jgi:hypothetical protein
MNSSLGAVSVDDAAEGESTLDLIAADAALQKKPKRRR